MTKKHFIALADTIRESNRFDSHCFTREAILDLAKFCKRQNPNFDCERWIDYIDGKCDPNGGSIK